MTETAAPLLEEERCGIPESPPVEVERGPAKVNRFSSVLVAMRPWSFSASFTPVVLGSVLVYKTVGNFNPWIFLATCLTAISVHAAGNLVNTYFDYVKGIDSKKSDDRTLVDEILKPNDVATLGGVFYTVGCLGFLLLVLMSPARMEHLALIYFGGLSGSFLYTGGLGLKYLALGDLVIFLTFGPVTVLFAYMSQGGELSWTPLLYALPMALNTEAILHSNNTRDMKTDAEAGIVTLAILIGEKGSYALFTMLLFVPYIMFAVLTTHVSFWFLLPLVTVILAFRLERVFRDGHLERLPHRLAQLNLQLGILYSIACGLSNTLPALTLK